MISAISLQQEKNTLKTEVLSCQIELSTQYGPE